jgi:fibronectin type 3 domain-containing protein
MRIAALRAQGRALAHVGLVLLGSCSAALGAPPEAPTILSATASIDSITLSWDAVQGAGSYNVYDALNGAPSASSSLDSNSTTATSLTFTPSSLGVPLMIAVTSVDAIGNESNDSAIRTISTLVTTVTLADQASGTSNLLVSWTAVAGAASYNIYSTQSATSGGPGPTENGAGVNVTAPAISYPWDAVTAGDYYTFAVSAVDQAGHEGGLSAPATIVAPAPP